MMKKYWFPVLFSTILISVGLIETFLFGTLPFLTTRDYTYGIHNLFGAIVAIVGLCVMVLGTED